MVIVVGLLVRVEKGAVNIVDIVKVMDIVETVDITLVLAVPPLVGVCESELDRPVKVACGCGIPS